MIDSSQLSFLMRLLDDESPTVETAVAAALKEFGHGLWEALDDLPVPPTPEQGLRIEELTGRGRPRTVETETTPPDNSSYQPGGLVRHCDLGYRGVIVALASKNTPSDSKMSDRRTPPVPDQPWYHVLVDGSTQVVRVAEEDLETDPSGRPVRHPLLDRFFDEFSGDVYRRNDVPWN